MIAGLFCFGIMAKGSHALKSDPKVKVTNPLAKVKSKLKKPKKQKESFTPEDALRESS